MKKNISAALGMIMCFTLFTACGKSSQPEITTADVNLLTDTESETETTAAEKVTISIGSLKGPTTMGMVKLMDDSDKGLTDNTYNVAIYGTADEIVAGIASGKIDVANVPANLSSVLYKKTEGEISVAAVNTLGVLYMVETGDTIKSIADLKGKTIYSTGKGTTPEYVLNYILTKNGLTPGKDVIIEYKSESTEVAAMLGESENAIALLPQPYVTVAQSKNDKIKICLDMTAEWNKINDNQLITGVVIARKDFISENPDVFEKFLTDYDASVKYVNANTDEAAKLVGGYDIVGEPVAKKALPLCNITFVRDQQMKQYVESYLSVLYEQDPTSIGGALPDENFYYILKNAE